jgi:nucleoside-diphosphate-sugar epimerase
VLADSFAAHYGLSIVSLRYTGVTLPDAWATLPRKAPPPAARAPYPHYVHVEDAARCSYLAAVADLPPSSHTRAFVTAEDTALDMPSEEWIARYFPNAERREKFDGVESLVSGRAAREKLGFVARHTWRGESGESDC